MIQHFGPALPRPKVLRVRASMRTKIDELFVAVLLESGFQSTSVKSISKVVFSYCMNFVNVAQGRK
jgi:hypothetical protein